MEVYLEYILIDNLIIDYIILRLTFLSVREKSNNWLLILSSIIGTIGAVCLSFVTLSPILGLIFKLILGMLMIFIANGKVLNFKKFFIRYILFICFTYLLGGMCFGIILAFNGQISNINNLTYTLSFPIGGMIGIICLFSFIITKVIKTFYSKRNCQNLTYNILVQIGSKQISFKTYLDTGNTLIDKKENLPVIILKYEKFYKLSGFNLFTNLINLNTNNIPFKCAKFIDYTTISSNNKMLVFQPDIIIDKDSKTEIKALIGLSLNLNKIKDYDGLFNAKCMYSI